MIRKQEPSEAARTNVRLVHTGKYYEVECDDHELRGRIFKQTNDQGEQARTAFSRLKHERSFERNSCDIPLLPGDAVFWREDVWHRTQDVQNDRLALILDVLRFPLQ